MKKNDKKYCFGQNKCLISALSVFCLIYMPCFFAHSDKEEQFQYPDKEKGDEALNFRNISHAILYYSNYLDESKRNKDQNAMLDAYDKLLNLYCAKGDKSKGVETYKDALKNLSELFRRNKDIADSFNIHRANIYIIEGNYAEANSIIAEISQNKARESILYKKAIEAKAVLNALQHKWGDASQNYRELASLATDDKIREEAKAKEYFCVFMNGNDEEIGQIQNDLFSADAVTIPSRMRPLKMLMLVKKGDHDEAMKYYSEQKKLISVPDSFWFYALYEFATSLEKGGRIDDASNIAEALNILADNDRDRESGFLLFVNILKKTANKEKFCENAMNFAKYFTNSPKRLNLILDAAKTYAGLGLSQKMIDAYKAIINDPYFSSQEKIKCGIEASRDLIELGKNEEACSILKENVFSKTNDPSFLGEAELLLADMLFRQGKLREALTQYLKIQSKYESVKENALYKCVSLCNQLKEYTKGYELAKKFISMPKEKTSAYPGVYLLLGDICSNLDGKDDEAINYYIEFTQKSDDQNKKIETLLKASDLYFSKKRFMDAQTILKKVRTEYKDSQNPLLARASYNILYTNIFLGDPEKIKSDIDEIIKVDLKATKYYYPSVLAVSDYYMNTGKNEDALELIEYFIKEYQSGNDSETNSAKNIDYPLSNKADKTPADTPALSVPQNNIGETPDKNVNKDIADLLYEKAYILYRMKKNDEALSAIELFLETGAESDLTPRGFFLKGEILSEKGNFSEAILEYEKASKKLPGSKLEIAASKRMADCIFSTRMDDKDNLKKALGIFETLRNRTDVPDEFMTQIKYSIARCHEEMGAFQNALHFYNDVVFSAPMEHQKSRDSVWIIRSAESAARLYMKQYRETGKTDMIFCAKEIYDKLIARGIQPSNQFKEEKKNLDAILELK